MQVSKGLVLGGLVAFCLLAPAAAQQPPASRDPATKPLVSFSLGAVTIDRVWLSSRFPPGCQGAFGCEESKRGDAYLVLRGSMDLKEGTGARGEDPTKAYVIAADGSRKKLWNRGFSVAPDGSSHQFYAFKVRSGDRQFKLFWPGIPEIQLPEPSSELADAQKGCEAGVPSDCNELARFYAGGIEVGKDLARAAEFYQQACDGNLNWACNSLGELYEKGQGVGQDVARARDLFQRVCERGEELGCRSLGRSDPTRAVGSYDALCQDGQSWACFRLGQAYEAGNGVSADPLRASELFKKACDTGSKLACTLLSQGVKPTTP